MQIEICLQVRITAEQVGQTFAPDTESSFVRQYKRIPQPLGLGGDLQSTGGVLMPLCADMTNSAVIPFGFRQHKRQGLFAVDTQA